MCANQINFFVTIVCVLFCLWECWNKEMYVKNRVDYGAHDRNCM